MLRGLWKLLTWPFRDMRRHREAEAARVAALTDEERWQEFCDKQW